MDRRGMKESSKQVREWSPAPGLVRSGPGLRRAKLSSAPYRASKSHCVVLLPHVD